MSVQKIDHSTQERTVRALVLKGPPLLKKINRIPPGNRMMSDKHLQRLTEWVSDIGQLQIVENRYGLLCVASHWNEAFRVYVADTRCMIFTGSESGSLTKEERL
jgi:hypothetical protein